MLCHLSTRSMIATLVCHEEKAVDCEDHAILKTTGKTAASTLSGENGKS